MYGENNKNLDHMLWLIRLYCYSKEIRIKGFYYYNLNTSLIDKFDDFFYPINVVPGSVGEILFKRICRPRGYLKSGIISYKRYN